MTTIYLVLKGSALLASMLLPLGGKRKTKKGADIELSNLAVNAKGSLEDLSKTRSNTHPIKIK